LVRAAEMLGAPAAVQKAIGGAVVSEPARALHDVGREHPRSKGVLAALDAIEAAQGPECLAVAVPFAVVLLVLAAEKARARDRADAARLAVEDPGPGVMGAELRLGDIRIA